MILALWVLSGWAAIFWTFLYEMKADPREFPMALLMLVPGAVAGPLAWIGVLIGRNA